MQTVIVDGDFLLKSSSKSFIFYVGVRWWGLGRMIISVSEGFSPDLSDLHFKTGMMLKT